MCKILTPLFGESEAAKKMIHNFTNHVQEK